MTVENGTRMPCERCGRRMYFHEQRQPYCFPCANVLGIERICDVIRSRKP